MGGSNEDMNIEGYLPHLDLNDLEYLFLPGHKLYADDLDSLIYPKLKEINLYNSMLKGNLKKVFLPEVQDIFIADNPALNIYIDEWHIPKVEQILMVRMNIFGNFNQYLLKPYGSLSEMKISGANRSNGTEMIKSSPVKPRKRL